MGGISVWQLLIIAVIVVVLFGTKKLRNVGGDLGSAIKSFKNAMNDDEKAEAQNAEKSEQSAQLEADEPKSAVSEEKTKENA